MKIKRTIEELRRSLEPARLKGKTIGFCPTMGALHEGHLSLVQKSLEETDLTVASIFVNPTQFGPEEDLSSYPRDEEKDCRLLEEAGCDFVFCPKVQEIYPNGACTTVRVTGVTDHLCGASRPGHFEGVATVVSKLLNIVGPHRAYFGIKDAQQLCVIETMVRDLDMPVLIRPCPIVREDDGLALSSRNRRLTKEHRNEASCLNRGLCKAKALFDGGERNAATLEKTVRDEIETNSGRVDYVEVVSMPDCQPIKTVSDRALIACAVQYGDVRLIDNVLLDI